MMTIAAHLLTMGRRFSGAMVRLATTALLAATPALAAASAEQQGFPSAALAVAALVAAVQNDDDAALLAILGADAEDLIISGDPVADRNDRLRFLGSYAEKHSLVQETPDRAGLLIGGRDYPFPIPLIRTGNGWRFDTAAGREEILDRRIGRNELHTIEVMHAYTAAQREFACRDRDGDHRQFAQKFSSSEGQKDGLYWESAEGEDDSPFGPLIARATGEGYRGGLDEDPPEPFHGYLFRILKAQGDHASGGAFDYVADGRMILGFALIAYPARYGVSGIMTFIVNQEGVIFEQDLGAATVTAAAAITTFDPDPTWRKFVAPGEP